MNKKSLAYIACALALFGCEDYNELNFEGYKDLAVPTDVKSINYTMKKADYADLFKLSQNKNVATSTITIDSVTGVADSTMYDAFIANQGNSYFTDLVPAELYLPAFLADKWSTATDGSSAVITVNELAEVPELNQQIAAAYTYTLGASDYAMAWEEGEGYEFFCPSTPASKFMSRILKDSFDDAEEGDVVMVGYNYAENDPSTNSEEEEIKIDKIADVIENGVMENATIQGTVAGTYGRGFLVQDETGVILVYLGIPANVSLGDKVQVAGPTSEYGGFAQFTSEATITRIEKSAFTYPTPTVLSVADMEAYLEKPSLKYVQYDGTLKLSGNYVNILIEGSEKVQGSVSYAVPGIIDATLDGQKVTVTGYAIGTSSGKYLNTMATSVVAAGETATFEPIGIVLGKENGDYTVRGTVVATYARGYLVTDGTGHILYYAGSNADAQIGDVVTISGAVTEYAGLKQFGNSATMTVLSSENKFTYPVLHTLTGANMDARLTAPAIEHVSYTGTLSISGNYYNVTIDDAETAVGSISYPAEGMVDASLDGQVVTVTGYFIGVSSGKYFNTMATSVTAATTKAAPRRAAANVKTTSVLALYQWNGSAWQEIEDVDVMQPSEYKAMGMSDNTLTDPATYIPLYLANNYPYAVNKQETTLVYINKSDDVVAESFIYDGSEWLTTGLEQGLYNFNLIDGEWVYKTFKCIPVSEVTESGVYVMVADIKVNEETGVTEGRLYSPLGENKSYGYMPYATVTINEEGIIEACDAAENAFLTLTAIEDGFTMQDTYGRYIYMKGDYNSFNIDTEIVQPGSSWKFNVNEDGTYSVTNVMNEKVIMYDTQYTSYGCYPAKTDARLYLNVFKMIE